MSNLSNTNPSNDVPLRVVLVDDEAHVRRRIRNLLAEEAVEIVGEADNGLLAVETIQNLNPDIAFLDVQMPGLNGFDVVHSLPPDDVPVVIFVTAYNQYAIQAFDVNAVDYVLKPIDKQRFAIAVERAAQKVHSGRQSQALNKTSKHTQEVDSSSFPCRKLLVKTGQSQEIVSVSDILWVEAADKYVRLHTEAQTHILRKTMAQMEKLLVGSDFVRIHRSTIVNIASIKEIRPATHGDAKIVLRDNSILALSRSYRAAFQARFSVDD